MPGDELVEMTQNERLPRRDSSLDNKVQRDQ
jgi:hypothetical protein